MSNLPEIYLLQGLGEIKLGDSVESAKAALARLGLESNYHAPTFTLYCEAIGGELSFTKESQQLYQIVIAEKKILLNGTQIIGERLDNAVERLRLGMFTDALWSIVDIDSEFVGGVPLANSKRSTRATISELVKGGTLWIKPQGLGLVMHYGNVESVCIRKAEDVPTVGCGPLTPECLNEAIDPEKFPSIPKPSPIVQAVTTRWKRTPVFRAIFTLLAIALLVFPAVALYRDITAWQAALPVEGTVVDTRPEGPFPDEIEVEYTAQDGKQYRRVLKFTYTTARAKGDKVDLLYRKEAPQNAMTRIQIQDDGLSVNPMYLFGCVLLSTFALVTAFPEYIRLNSRKNR